MRRQETRMKQVAVTGATGYVGKFVVPELLRRGATVRALARPTSDRSGFDSYRMSAVNKTFRANELSQSSAEPAPSDADIEWIEGTLRDTTALHRLVKGADAVVHLAYSHVPGRYRGGEGDDLPDWLDVNLNGSIQLLLAARAAQVPQFIFLSSRAVFSHTEPGRVLDETHPVSPVTHYGAYKVAVEAMMRSFDAEEGMQTTSIRATGVYGRVWPVDQSKWWDLIAKMLRNEPVLTNRGGTEVHGRDVARTVATLVRRPEMAPDLIHLSDLYITHRQIVDIARKVAGCAAPLPPPPDTPMRNELVCTHLADLGITLGGIPLLEKTIHELVAAARLHA